jgi:hypothetical protein
MVLWASSAALAVLMGAMVVLWVVATVHHLQLTKGQSEPVANQPAAPRREQHV